MTKPIDPYSRVYWRVLDDPKFDSIRGDMRHFGSWSLMLLVADMAHPAPAFVPPSVPARSLAALVDVGLVDILPGGLYRLHGLDAERTRRGAAAAASASVRWSERNAVASAREPEPMLDKTRQDKTRQDEGEEAPALAYLASIGATVQPNGNGYHRDLVTLIGRKGIESVMDALKRRYKAGDRAPRQLIYGASNDLEPIHRPSGKSEAKGLGPSAEEAERAFSS